MENILTLGLTPEETVQMKTELDAMLVELKRMRENMRRDDLEIAALRTRTKIKMAHIDEMLARLREK